jgi:hypothetical protein
MADPQGVSVALYSPAFYTEPAWERIDDRNDIHVVSGWSIDRGRNSELNKMKTGTASVSIVDKYGTLDPTNHSGHFAGHIEPLRPAAVALRNPEADTWHTLFRGFTGDLELDLHESGTHFTGTWTWNDGFDTFAGMEMTPGNAGDTVPAGSEGDIYYPDQQVNARINQALSDAGWPVGTQYRTIYSGNVAVQGKVYARRDQLLTVLLDASDAEFPGVANIFMSKDGRVVFHGRFARFYPSQYVTHGITEWYAGDLAAAQANPSSARLAAGGLSFRRGISDIINACLAIPEGVTDTEVPDSLVIDPASIYYYGWRTLEFPNLLTLHGDEAGGNLSAVAETKLFAQYYVDNYSYPHTRVSTLRFRTPISGSLNSAATWALICGVDISDVIHLKTTHPGGGGFDEAFYVEGIRYSASPLGLSDSGYPDVTLELDVSPTSFFSVNPFSS